MSATDKSEQGYRSCNGRLNALIVGQFQESCIASGIDVHIGGLWKFLGMDDVCSMCKSSRCMIWEKTSADGHSYVALKKIIRTDRTGNFQTAIPIGGEIQIAIFAPGFKPWVLVQNIVETMLDVRVKLERVSKPKRAKLRIVPALAMPLANAILKIVDVTIATQPELPAQAVAHDGTFSVDHAMPGHRYALALMVPDGRAPFHCTYARINPGSTIVLNQRSTTGEEHAHTDHDRASGRYGR